MKTLVNDSLAMGLLVDVWYFLLKKKEYESFEFKAVHFYQQ